MYDEADGDVRVDRRGDGVDHLVPLYPGVQQFPLPVGDVIGHVYYLRFVDDVHLKQWRMESLLLNINVS